LKKKEIDRSTIICVGFLIDKKQSVVCLFNVNRSLIFM